MVKNSECPAYPCGNECGECANYSSKKRRRKSMRILTKEDTMAKKTKKQVKAKSKSKKKK